MREAAIIAQNLFYGVISASVAGTVCVILILLLGKKSKYMNHRLKIVWIKLAEILYLFPLAAVMVVWSRADISIYGVGWSSDFWRTATSQMQTVYLTVVGASAAGVLTGVIYRSLQYRKLWEVLRGNIPVEDELCLDIIAGYQKKYHLKDIVFYQNDLLDNPICLGIWKPMIVLPVKCYTEKELHIILEHEICHIKRRDLFWKKMGLLVTFIYWWNPFSYILLKELIFQEEVECDITTCENTSRFTKRDYVLYLTGLEDSRDDMIFVTALCKTKRDTVRRVEGMARGKNYTKKAAVASCLMMAVLAFIPSYAAAEGVAQANEQWIAESIVETQQQLVDYASLENQMTLDMESDVQEIDLSAESDSSLYNANVVLDRTIAKNTRILYKWMQMNQGDAITVIANCSDDSMVYRVGIRDSSGNMTYVQGTGSITHVFTIPSAGSYTVYVQNTSTTKSLTVTGRATYINY